MIILLEVGYQGAVTRSLALEQQLMLTCSLLYFIPWGAAGLSASFLFITCQGFPVPLMDVFVAWPEEFKRNCFLSK